MVEGAGETTRRRIEPSVGVAVAAGATHLVVVSSMQVTSGVDYQDWFDTAGNAVRSAVIPLVLVTVLLVAFVAWVRWDLLWRDPERLPMSRLAHVTLVLFALTVVARLAGMSWSDVPVDLLLAALATGVLVGLAEELLFRGIVLRCLRTDDRPESSAALWTAVGFGLFHLPNIFFGTGLFGLSQIPGGRGHGLRAVPLPPLAGPLSWVAMVAHGCWDAPTFLSANYGSDLGNLLGFALNVLVGAASILALVRSLAPRPRLHRHAGGPGGPRDLTSASERERLLVGRERAGGPAGELGGGRDAGDQHRGEDVSAA